MVFGEVRLNHDFEPATCAVDPFDQLGVTVRHRAIRRPAMTRALPRDGICENAARGSK
jgi:hypothetical protein